jgi:hypothetical protein
MMIWTSFFEGKTRKNREVPRRWQAFVSGELRFLIPPQSEDGHGW